jgi:hypothetical protein
MFFNLNLSLICLAAITVKFAGADSYPSGQAQVWEFVNCVHDATGQQTEEVWKWHPGNPPSTSNSHVPNLKAKILTGPYYWEGKQNVFYDSETNQWHDVYIFDGVSTNQPGPLGMSVFTGGDPGSTLPLSNTTFICCATNRESV